MNIAKYLKITWSKKKAKAVLSFVRKLSNGDERGIDQRVLYKGEKKNE